MGRAGFVDAQPLPTATPIPLVPGGRALNPSVTADGEKLRVIIRTLVDPPGAATRGAVASTINFLGDILDGRLANVRRMADVAVPGFKRLLYGIEDARIFTHDGKLRAIATIAQPINTGFAKAEMCLFDINADGDFSNPLPIQSPRYERNWMVATDRPVNAVADRLRLVYSPNPLVVLTCDIHTGSVQPPPGSFTPQEATLRGSSQLVPWNDGYVCVTHEVAGTHPTIVYTHRFVRFDKDLTRTLDIGRPFYFQERGIEFCAGLTWWRDRFVISYGVADRAAYAAEIDPATVAEFLHH
jgi:predicted GH43/DUF377 family glycosyl hydrolase